MGGVKINETVEIGRNEEKKMKRTKRKTIEGNEFSEPNKHHKNRLEAPTPTAITKRIISVKLICLNTYNLNSINRIKKFQIKTHKKIHLANSH